MTKKPTSTLIRLTGKAGACRRSFQKACPERSRRVAGVDGCRAGWFVVIASVAKYLGPQFIGGFPYIYKLRDSFVARTFAEALSKTTDCKLVCVDIPIGLSNGDKPRQCDIAARKILGKGRASSVFPPPIRSCLPAKDLQIASEICFKHSGKKLNRQSFFIMDKIRQVDDLMTPRLQQRVREIHPELVFWALNGKKPMQHNKKTLTGRNERMNLLSLIFSDVAELVAKARNPKEAEPDDILDALAAAWTAGQAVLGKAETLPENPEIDGRDLRMEILNPIVTIDS